MSDLELRRAVQRFFRRYSSARLSMPTATGNVYELFVYTLVCESVMQAGCQPQLNSAQPGEFRFRCSPGPVSSAFSFHSFTGPSGSAYEIRGGIEVRGHSMMAHEADIAIFRVLPGPTNQLGGRADLVLCIECKCYSSASDLKPEARKAVGMIQDWSTTAHPSQVSGQPRGCIHCGLHFMPAFVTNVRAGQRRDIEQYLEAYDLGPRFGIVPRSGAIAQFKSALAQLITSL